MNSKLDCKKATSTEGSTGFNVKCAASNSGVYTFMFNAMINFLKTLRKADSKLNNTFFNLKDHSLLEVRRVRGLHHCDIQKRL